MQPRKLPQSRFAFYLRNSSALSAASISVTVPFGTFGQGHGLN